MDIPQHHRNCPCDFCKTLRRQKKLIDRLVAACKLVQDANQTAKTEDRLGEMISENCIDVINSLIAEIEAGN